MRMRLYLVEVDPLSPTPEVGESEEDGLYLVEVDPLSPTVVVVHPLSILLYLVEVDPLSPTRRLRERRH